MNPKKAKRHSHNKATGKYVRQMARTAANKRNQAARRARKALKNS